MESLVSSPFKFLDSYQKDDKEIFFSRETETEEIYTKVFQSKMLLVYGASGTGKSSLIACGLANKFQDTDWLPINVRRGLNINQSLIQQLGKMTETPFTSHNVGLIRMLKSVYLDNFKPIFLVFDQFEELFIFGDKEEWIDFTKSVRDILDSSLQVRLVFVIRGEYLEYLTEFETIIPEFFSNRIRVEKMTRAKAVHCITGPCRTFAIQVDDQFPENLLAKLSPNKTEIELTFLQVFLDRIYRRAIEVAQRGVVVFSNGLLNELGNVGDILSQFLDEQIELMPDREKALALLKAFVSTDATKQQINVDQATDFVRTIGHDLNKNQVEQIIRDLVNRRILKDKDEADRYELRHDSIATRIFNKITSYERDLIEVNHFVQYAYAENSRRNFLLNESDLLYIAPYEGKLKLSDAVLDFIRNSKAVVRRKKRSRKQFYILMSAISILFLTSVFGLIYSNIQKTKADNSAKVAKDQSDEALKQKEIAEQQRILAEQKQVEADAQATIATQQKTIADAQKLEAERQRSLANILQINAEEGRESAIVEKIKADSAKVEAEKYSRLAERNSQIASEERNKAARLRMLALAQAMGIKAVQLQDVDQKVLVALQAYQFNRQHDGYYLQSEIFNGLYSAYEAMDGDEFNVTYVHKEAVKGMVYLGGNDFITGGSDGKIYKVSAGDVKLVDNTPLVLQSMALSDDKKVFAVGSQEGKIRVYDVVALKMVKEIDHKSAIWALEFDKSGNLFFSGSDKRISKWDPSTSKPNTLADVGAMVNTLSYRAKDNSIAAGLSNGEVVIINIANGDVLRNLKVPKAKAVTTIKFNSSGTILAIGREDGSISLWDAVVGELGQTLNGHKSIVSDLRFSTDNSFLLSASYDGSAMVWNMNSLNQRQIVLSDHGGWVLQASFNDKGDLVTTGDALGTVRYFPLNMDFYYTTLCEKMKRNMTVKEWETFVGEEVPYSTTCVK